MDDRHHLRHYPRYYCLDSVEDGVLSITPAVPSQVDRIGVANVYYRGNHLNIEAGRGFVSLEGTRIRAAR